MSGGQRAGSSGTNGSERRAATRPPLAGAGDRARRFAVGRLVERHGEELLATARRYAASREDAEDAYQRAIEIVLARAPAVSDEDLVPWTKTVIKHEAYAIWRGRERVISATGEQAFEEEPSRAPTPDEQVQRIERLHHGAEAIKRLKPQEVRCLLLRAEGHSYRQICEITGWTYTKVNRAVRPEAREAVGAAAARLGRMRPPPRRRSRPRCPCP